MNVCQMKNLIYVLLQIMKFYACEYKTQGITVMFPVIENITFPRQTKQCPKEFNDAIHVNTLVS
jgi:hypothetical protein